MTKIKEMFCLFFIFYPPQTAGNEKTQLRLQCYKKKLTITKETVEEQSFPTQRKSRYLGGRMFTARGEKSESHDILSDTNRASVLSTQTCHTFWIIYVLNLHKWLSEFTRTFSERSWHGKLLWCLLLTHCCFIYCKMIFLFMNFIDSY